MQKRSRQILRILTAVFLMAVCVAAIRPEEALAQSQTVAMASCKLNSKGNKITVKAKVKEKTSGMGSKLYLLGLDAHASETGSRSGKPLASVKAKKGTVKFQVKYKSSMLYQKFVVACKKGNKYKIISNARYITNPQALASYKSKGPKASSKKGIQAEELADSLEIGTKHVVLNWTLNSLLNQNAIHKNIYKYRGTTYYLDGDIIQRNDELVKAYNNAGVRVTVILLLPRDFTSSQTLSMQYGGYADTKYSSVKTSSKAGCRTFEAVMTYLAKRYGTKKNLVTGWILGNEVNSAGIWNYGGDKTLNNYMRDYARAFRICNNAVRSVSKHSSVYISLDNNWNRDLDGKGKRYFSAKSILDTFYTKLKEQGNINFKIAYHAYPQGMGDPVFWDDTMASNSVNAKIVNFKNLNVLTNYAKKNFGKDCKVMLSEQSFNSSRGEAYQAAAYAYAYYISESNSMIEAFIYGREFDHGEETKDGFYWGLCNNWHEKRLIWSVFQYIDTKDSFKFTNPLLPYTNIKKWTKISGFQKTTYSKQPSIRMKAAITGVENLSSTSLILTWDKINTGDGYEIYRNDKLVATILGNSTVTYTDRDLKPGETYKYKVRMFKEAPAANNANRREKLYGSFSPGKSVTAVPAQVVLNGTESEVSGNQIKIAWRKMDDVSGYEILRSASLNGAYTAVGDVGGTRVSYTDKETVTGAMYYYKVRAYVTANGKKHYGKDSEVAAKQSMIQLSAKMVDGKVVLNWTQWPNETEYRVYCAPKTTNIYKRIKIINSLTHTTYRYKDAAGNNVVFEMGQTYYFRVKAASGNYYSNTLEFTVNEPVYSTGASDGSKEPSVTQSEPSETEATQKEPQTTAIDPAKLSVAETGEESLDSRTERMDVQSTEPETETAEEG